ncbi:hypothetical protein CUJ83_00070 [Methanocella sp. CWC-04]|uniref:Uncharacterized protein n=1 Tax=Methanooceanicella nereidis TaxID=2052831 RepID=A0AAP2R9W9_9EURY|nr:hypothetical protein [Methanocella sp. CWC-04]MCD1293393.1 hypothetical protein [Methanocella sp. CWC-04]
MKKTAVGVILVLIIALLASLPAANAAVQLGAPFVAICDGAGFIVPYTCWDGALLKINQSSTILTNNDDLILYPTKPLYHICHNKLPAFNLIQSSDESAIFQRCYFYTDTLV